MENNNTSINLSSLLGLNAFSFDGTNDCFQNQINKSLGNGKQYITSDIKTTDVNNSLLDTLNMIDSTIKTDGYDISLKNESTYTLEDLLDLGTEDLNPSVLFDASTLEDENSLLMTANQTNQILLETAMASPLSSSSDESCDLDDLLFMEDTLASNQTSMETEVLDEVLASSVNNTVKEVMTVPDSSLETIDQASLQEMLISNGSNLAEVCSLLFQSQNISSLPQSEGDAESLTFSEPSSPTPSESSSVSESESVRYNPYKKHKTPEQKQRKKAQNRTAATRYRVKKKDELKAMSEEADQLEKKNKDLKGKVDGLRSEIDYLKNLMLDVIKARLSKGATPDNLLAAVMAQ